MHLVGKVRVAEDAVRTLAATVPGRIERLFVNTTGMQVHAGDHLFEIFSPELLTAQEELLAARRRLDEVGEDASEFAVESASSALHAARKKLELWQLAPERIAEIETGGRARASLQIDAPFSGTVLERFVDQGAYVKQGEPAFVLADLSRLWVELEAFEQDLPFLRYGQRVELELDALPGRTLEGSVSFVDPGIDPATHTASVRVHVENRSGDLRPGLFVRGTSFARLDAGGHVRSADLAGKWISPMHPEVISDQPGTCSVCGMDLVRVEELGLVDSGPASDPVVVQRDAVLWTGRRSLVYVEVEPGVYEVRSVELGPRAGEHFVLLSGVEEGERVVTRGAFRIDSEMQIRSKPSMLDQPGEVREEVLPVRYSPEHDAVWRDVLEATRALSADEPGPASRAFEHLEESARTALETESGPDAVRAALRELHRAAEAIAGTEGLEPMRAGLESVTERGAVLARARGQSKRRTAAHCLLPDGGRR